MAKSLFLRILNLPLWPIYWLSGFMPRRRDLWAFGAWGGKTFSDNSRWTFVQVAKGLKQQDAPVRAVWFTRDKRLARELESAGIDVLRPNTIRGIQFALRAGVFVVSSSVNDISPWLSRGARVANLWHGIPLKEILLDQIAHQRKPRWIRIMLSGPEAFLRADLVVATSPETRQRFASTFGIPAERVKVCGYPRNDPLLDPEAGPWLEDELTLRCQIRNAVVAGQKIVCYMPTFRDHWTITTRMASLIAAVRASLDLKTTLLLVKLHAVDAARLDGTELTRGITIVPHGVDPSTFLPLVDALVTDYSSVFFDTLLLDQPTVFYAPDLEEYQRRERPFYYEYAAVTPGARCIDQQELARALRECTGDPVAYRHRFLNKRNRLKERLHAFQDAGSAERTVAEIRSLLGNNSSNTRLEGVQEVVLGL